MKYKLLGLNYSDVCNIGDYIQALASAQFLPKVDGFINREALNRYSGEKCKVIMNGWFMHLPDNWPPSSQITPLFVAFHLNITAKEKMLNDEGIAYLRKHEPIGCRDINTVRLLNEKNVKAYFSACMTLTLGNKYLSNVKEDVFYFVDPVVPVPRSFKSFVKNGFTLIANYGKIHYLCGQLYEKGVKITMIRLIKVAGFYRLYRKVFDPTLIMSAVYIKQQSAHYKNDFTTHESRLEEAERLVKLYSRAKIVVTSRIHCALPCLGMKTPVIFTEKSKDEEVSICRLEGLKELFNVLKVDEDNIESNFKMNGYIDKKNIPQNKTLWEKYAKDLSYACEMFIKNK